MKRLRDTREENLLKSLFKQTSQVSGKPKVIVSQKFDDVVCVWASWRNLFPDDNISLSEFKDEYRLTIKQRHPTWTDVSIKKFMLELINSRGISGDCTGLMLKHGGIEYRKISGFDTKGLRLIKNGFIHMTINNAFNHVVCIKNGWVIDSIDSVVYQWRGNIWHYSKVLLTMGQDLDKSPIIEERSLVITIED